MAGHSDTSPNNPQSPSYLLNVTDSISSKGDNQLFQAIGFRVHRVRVGSKPALVKVYDGLPPGSIADSQKDLIHDVSTHSFLRIYTKS